MQLSTLSGRQLSAEMACTITMLPSMQHAAAGVGHTALHAGCLLAGYGPHLQDPELEGVLCTQGVCHTPHGVC